MARITFLLADAFNARNLKRLGVDFIHGNGHEVTCLDVSDIVHPMIARDRSDYLSLDRALGVVHVKDSTLR